MSEDSARRCPRGPRSARLLCFASRQGNDLRARRCWCSSSGLPRLPAENRPSLSNKRRHVPRPPSSSNSPCGVCRFFASCLRVEASRSRASRRISSSGIEPKSSTIRVSPLYHSSLNFLAGERNFSESVGFGGSSLTAEADSGGGNAVSGRSSCDGLRVRRGLVSVCSIWKLWPSGRSPLYDWRLAHGPCLEGSRGQPYARAVPGWGPIRMQLHCRCAPSWLWQHSRALTPRLERSAKDRSTTLEEDKTVQKRPCGQGDLQCPVRRAGL